MARGLAGFAEESGEGVPSWYKATLHPGVEQGKREGGRKEEGSSLSHFIAICQFFSSEKLGKIGPNVL